jgi:hypothetical protein
MRRAPRCPTRARSLPAPVSKSGSRRPRRQGEAGRDTRGPGHLGGIGSLEVLVRQVSDNPPPALHVNATAQIIGLRRLVPTPIRKSPRSRSRSDSRYPC